MGTSRAAKAASHDRILDAAAALIRRDGLEGLSVADLMAQAGLTHGGFYRHFDSREQLVTEAAHRALNDGSAPALAASALGGRRGFRAVVKGYLSAGHRDHPEAGCAVAALVRDMAQATPAARAAYTRQVEMYLSVLAGLLDQADAEEARRTATLTLSALVGALSLARAVDDPALSTRILADAQARVLDCASP